MEPLCKSSQPHTVPLLERIERLPPEIIMMIFNGWTLPELFKLSHAAKAFREFIGYWIMRSIALQSDDKLLVYKIFGTSFAKLKEIIEKNPQFDQATKKERKIVSAATKNPAIALVSFFYTPSAQLKTYSSIKLVLKAQPKKIKQYFFKPALAQLLNTTSKGARLFIKNNNIQPDQFHPLVYQAILKCLEAHDFEHAKKLQITFKLQLDCLYYTCLMQGAILRAVILVKKFDVRPDKISLEPSIIQQLYDDIEQSESLSNLFYLIHELKILPNQSQANRLLYLCLEKSYRAGAELLKTKCRATLESASNISTTDEPQTPITFRTLR